MYEAMARQGRESIGYFLAWQLVDADLLCRVQESVITCFTCGNVAERFDGFSVLKEYVGKSAKSVACWVSRNVKCAW